MNIGGYDHKPKFSQNEFFDSPGPGDVPNELLMKSFQTRAKNSKGGMASNVSALSSSSMPAESSIRMRAEKISSQMGQDIDEFQDVESRFLSWVQKFLVFSAAFVAIVLLVMVGLGVHYNNSLSQKGRVAGEDSSLVTRDSLSGMTEKEVGDRVKLLLAMSGEDAGRLESVYRVGDIEGFGQLGVSAEFFKEVRANDYLVLLEDRALIYRPSWDFILKELSR
jgi:hypothetical protein